VSLASIGLAALAGILSTLSPCVLPLIPMVLGAAISEHRHGPVALAAGLAVSFVAIGLFIATIGYSLGFDSGLFRIRGGPGCLNKNSALLSRASAGVRPPCGVAAG